MLQYTPELGKIINGDARRDAIHIAVAPVFAGMRLSPGEHVFVQGNLAYNQDYNHKKLIGIVDPFLKQDVTEGQVFWLFLYPNTVTSLRHVWTHPSF